MMAANLEEVRAGVPQQIAAEIKRHGSPADYALKERGVAIGGLS